jgi:hypothetical protein
VLEAFRRLSNFIRNTAVPAFQAFVEYIKLEILPKLQDTFDILQNMAKQITEKLAPAVKNTLVGAFDTLKESCPAPSTCLNKVLQVLKASLPQQPPRLTRLIESRRQSKQRIRCCIVGQVTKPVCNIPGLAEGGIVTGPTLAMIGEAGPEAVVPLDRMSGGGITINVTGGLATSAEIGESVVNALRAYSRSAGPLQLQVA